MWNFLLGYLLARSLVGERAARTGGLIVILGVLLFLFALGGSFFELFAKSFFKGVEDGLRQWVHPHEVKTRETSSWKNTFRVAEDYRPMWRARGRR